jgi:2-hydroxy-6-oxonona-2,4-dienedioate hydrolase
VLVHGLGVTRRHLEPAVAEFARERPTFAPDLPRGARVGELAAYLDRWTDAARVPRAVFLGNSMGCQVAVELAASRPAKVAALVLVGPTVDAAARSRVRQLARLALDSAREPVRLDLVVVTDYVRSGPIRTVRWARKMVEHRLEARLPEVAAPTLVVRGERDPIVPDEWAARVARSLPRGELVVVPGAAHAVHYSHAPELRAIVADFLTRSQQEPG